MEGKDRGGEGRKGKEREKGGRKGREKRGRGGREGGRLRRGFWGHGRPCMQLLASGVFSS